ncbi:MAG: hypothetical protein K1W19_01615 [Lachnospiraceae bacterium]|jgi:hypothetical protein|nr:hypothetical protein [Lachnospiraceae bacterium]MCI8825883.1 hypothetical protein [Lachnospiraceae bacterium]MCI9368849.1 hypothetical protein [Lachnospiraceae bacterium]MDE7308326.1 hypothetical protein [Lachnospiraceae bacterium]
MDIKEKIDKVVNKVKSDKNFKNKLMKDPVNALEEVLGVDLPNEQIDKIIDGVKAKITKDKAEDLMENVGEKLSGIFKK